MDIEVNYKNKKRYHTAKYKGNQNKFWMFLIAKLSKLMLCNKEYTIERINMDGLKAPYIMLSNHMHFIDFELAAVGLYPQPVNNVVTIDGYYRRFFLIEWIKGIAHRKFSMDLELIKTIRKVLKNNGVLAMYPEARYTPDGTGAYLPESLGKLIKQNKVPLVVITHHGNHLYAPVWNFRQKRKVPLHVKIEQVLTAEEVANLSVDEINAVLRKAFTYDDYRYQKDNGILIKEPYRAEGLHKILYQCPKCKTEFSMDSKGAEIFCNHCGKRWVWEENGYIRALDGETEFDHIPDWFAWEREQVNAEVERGEYSFSDEMEVFSFPRVYRWFKLGKAKLTHDAENGFILDGFYRGEPYHIHLLPGMTNSLQVEYNLGALDAIDHIAFSTPNDSFFCRLTKPEWLTKLGFATEAIYQRHIRLKKLSDQA